MALSSNGSFIPTANEFLAHWADADALLGAMPVVLAGEPGVIPPGFNRSGLVVLRDTLQGDLDAVQDKLNDLQIAAGGLEILKQRMHKRLALFVGVMDGFYVNTEFYRARPEAAVLGAGEERFMAPLRDMKSLWAKLNVAPAPAGLEVPIILNEGTEADPLPVTVAQFEADLVVLRAKYAERADREQAVNLARSRRDKTMKSIRAVLVAYRAAAESRLAGDAALLATLPRVTPLPGHTPEKVSIAATFVAPDIAEVTHGESDDTDFKEYQLQGTAGEDGSLVDAVVLATHTGRVPSPFSTQHGLGQPGGAVSLWVVVVTHDGNERTSDRVVVRRPL